MKVLTDLRIGDTVILYKGGCEFREGEVIGIELDTEKKTLCNVRLIHKNDQLLFTGTRFDGIARSKSNSYCIFTDKIAVAKSITEFRGILESSLKTEKRTLEEKISFLDEMKHFIDEILDLSKTLNSDTL